MEFTNRVRHLLRPNGTAVPFPPFSVEEPAPETALEERQQLLAHHVRLVARGMSNGLCVFGSRGGLGKTRIVLQTLLEELARPIILNGHITPLSLYTNLYFNSDEIIFLDDCDSLYRNLPALGILRSALWGQTGDARLVTYNSSQLGIASAFHFTGRIIFTANILPKKNPAFDAVLSRIDLFELDASNAEVIELMKHLAKQGFENLLPHECLEVVDFIAEFASTRDLSLRLLEPSFRKVLYARQQGVDWRDLVRSQLEQLGKDVNVAKPQVNEMDCLKQIVRDHGSAKDQVEAWTRLDWEEPGHFLSSQKETG